MLKTTAVLVALAVLASCGSTAGQPPRVRPARVDLTATDLAAFLDPLVHKQIDSRKIAGAIVVLVKDGRILYQRAMGLADVRAGRPMRADTLVRIGSATKTLTALAVMQLVQAGRLDLDHDVNRYLDIRVAPLPGGEPVTLRRLLTHRTGFEDRTGQLATITGPRLPLGPFLARHMPRRLRQAPDVVAYSNFNAALAAYVVERTSGEPFEQYLAHRIFQPLGMDRTTAEQPLPAALAAHVSAGYVRSDRPETVISSGAATIHEAGSTAVCTTADDMGRLMHALLDLDPSVIARASLSEMMTPQVHTPHGFVGLGMYLPVGAGRNPFIGHDGGTGGFQTVLALLPEQRFGLFASYNSTGVPARVPAHAELLQQVADRYFGDVNVPRAVAAADPVPGSYQSTRRVRSSVFSLRALVGQWFVRRRDDNTLVVQNLLPIGGTVFVKSESALFRNGEVEIAFATVGGDTFMQAGAALPIYMRVPWYESAQLWIPVILVSVVAGVTTLIVWPVARIRSRVRQQTRGRGAPALGRVVLLLYLLAIASSIWLVFWGWDLAALSSPLVSPVTLGIYTTAWVAVGLTPFAVWNAWHGDAGRCRWTERALSVLLLLLAFFCVYWRVAGTTLAL